VSLVSTARPTAHGPATTFQVLFNSLRISRLNLSSDFCDECLNMCAIDGTRSAVGGGGGGGGGGG
jgi:hypothetical protein